MILSSGNSENDRISFWSEECSITAIRKENGEIRILYGNQRDNFLLAQILLIVIAAVLILLKAIILNFFCSSLIIKKYLYLFPAFVYMCGEISGIINIRKKGKEILRNHGAEHMVFAAYVHLKKIPTVKEARKFSRISKTCGVSIFSCLIMSQIIGFLIYFFTDVRVSEILLLVIGIIFKNHFPFTIITAISQFFTTAKPKDENLELAIAVISALEDQIERNGN